MICGSTLSCSTAPLSQKLLQLPRGTKNCPAHPSLPHSAMGKRPAARICWILGAAQLERKFFTHTRATWGSWGQKRDFSSPRTLGLEERSTHLNAPALGLYLCPALPWNSLQQGWIHTCLVLLLFASPQRGSAPHRGVSVPWIHPTLLSGEEWRQTSGPCDCRAPPGQLSSIPHTPNSPFAVSTELQRLNTIPESQNH